MAKLVDALDLGSSAARRGGSSPSTRTIFMPSSFFYFLTSHSAVNARRYLLRGASGLPIGGKIQVLDVFTFLQAA